MIREKGRPSRGVLRQEKSYKHAKHNRFYANEILNPFIEHFWTVSWNLPQGESYVAETLPYPSVHIVFEKEETKLYGVTRNRFSVNLMEKGSVIGIKFRPGGFYPFYKKNVSLLTDKRLPCSDLLGHPISALRTKIFKIEKDEDRVELIQNWFVSLQLNEDPMIAIINSIVDRIQGDRTMQSVAQISEYFCISVRRLQRLFQKYVGVSPKWVILRFRMQEVAERLEKGKNLDYAETALEMGYFDQAHFIKDFKNTIGLSPEDYIKSLL